MAEKKNGEAATRPAPGGGPSTKVDAVGLALAELGKEASRAEIQSWVKERFGYEMSLDHVSDCKKALAKKSGAAKPAGGKKPGPKAAALKPQAKAEAVPPQEPAQVAEPIPVKSEADMAEKKTAAKEQIGKKEAVRRSLAKLGKDATPADIQKDVKERFGIEMGAGHISTTKGELRREAEARSAGKNQKASKPAAQKPKARQETAAPPKPAAASARSSNGKGAVEMDDILALRGLLDRVGVDQLRTLISVMAR